MKYPILAVALLASASAFAGGPGCDHGAKMDRITADLQLNEEQAAQVEQILEAKHERMRSQRTALHEETIAELRGVLTEEQIQKLQANWEQRGHHGHSEADATDAGV